MLEVSNVLEPGAKALERLAKGLEEVSKAGETPDTPGEKLSKAKGRLCNAPVRSQHKSHRTRTSAFPALTPLVSSVPPPNIHHS